MGRPLITNKGELFAPAKADCPRKRILVLDPAPADGGEMSRPATLPSKEDIMLVVRFCCTSFTLTVLAEYPNLLDSRLIPKAVTTTSSMLRASTFILTARERL